MKRSWSERLRCRLCKVHHLHRRHRSLSLHDRFIDLDIPLYHAIYIEELGAPSAVLSSNALNEAHLIDSVGDALNDESCLAIDKYLWNASLVCRNNRRTTGERLNKCKAERFRKRNQVQATVSPVSYTHLTLPTNREV